MLDINPLLIILFANIFSHSLCCLFNLSMISFVFKVVQKADSLEKTLMLRKIEGRRAGEHRVREDEMVGWHH